MSEPYPTPELNAALSALQGELPTFGDDMQREVVVEHKDGTSHSYKYVTLNTIMETVGPLMATHGLSFSALPGYNDTGDGKVMLSLRYRLAHKSGEEITGLFPLPGGDGQGTQGQRIQAMGSAISYARRYCLASVLGIAAEQDDDGRAASLMDDDGQPRTAQRAQRSRTARTEQAAANTARRRQVAADAPAPAAGEEPKEYGPPREPDAEITGPQQQKLVMQFKDLGIVDRDARLGVVSQLVGFRVESFKALTKGQAHELIEVVDSALATPDPIQTLKNAAADVAARKAAQQEDPASE